MKRLSKNQFQLSTQYLKTQAQDIDKAMYEYFFEDKSIDSVLDILASYQNDDGGFGMLDYDIECPVSCLKSTESACRYLFKLGAIPSDHPIIQKLIPYLLKNYNRITGEWDHITVAEVNQYPHAPWWEHQEDGEPFIPKDRAELIAHYNPNTNSALAGMLVQYASLVPEDILNQVMGIVIDKINSGYQFGQYGMTSDIYFVNAIKDGELKAGLLKTLMGGGKLISILDDTWGTENAYKLCHWIPSPSHPYYSLYKKAVDDNLDFLIDSQENDGSWPPNWSWGAPEAWQRVLKRLKGSLTFEFLWTLKNFDRIED